MTTPASDRYRRLALRFSDLVDAVPHDAWSNPSPCSDWLAIDVFHHVVTTQADLYGRMSFASPLELVLGDEHDPAELRAAWAIVRTTVQATLDTPSYADLAYDGYFGPTTFALTVDQFYSFDLVVHAWDLAHATAMHAYERLDPVEMAKCRADFASLSDTMRQPGLLGPELKVMADADEQTMFLGFLGRSA
jgi:uncharacterized protein (TIGR03086 family)